MGSPSVQEHRGDRLKRNVVLGTLLAMAGVAFTVALAFSMPLPTTARVVVLICGGLLSGVAAEWGEEQEP